METTKTTITAIPAIAERKVEQTVKIAFTGTVNFRVDYYLEILIGKYPNVRFECLGRKGMEEHAIEVLKGWKAKVTTPQWTKREFLREYCIADELHRTSEQFSYFYDTSGSKGKHVRFDAELAASRFRYPWQYDIGSKWWTAEDAMEAHRAVWEDETNITLSDCDFGPNYAELHRTRNERLLENAKYLFVFSEDYVSKQLQHEAERRGIEVITRL